MRVPPQARRLEGGRLHLQHGPIDLILRAHGESGAVAEAEAAAARRFATVLDELCAELPALRAPAGPDAPALGGRVARAMAAAVAPFAAGCFITPMAAVAGAVAQEILGTMVASAPLDRAFVNNGGDIALHLGPGTSFFIGLVDRPDRPSLLGRTTIRAGEGIGGVATSGWRGRSFSLGIADAVTVLARTAAEADAAATAIANAVDLPGHPAVRRERADAVQADSDLGARLVTRGVGRLSEAEVEEALAGGVDMADSLLRRGLILAAALHAQGATRIASRRAPSPLAGEGGPTKSGRMRGSPGPTTSCQDTAHAAPADPSSVMASACHLLSEGEKERAPPPRPDFRSREAA